MLLRSQLYENTNQGAMGERTGHLELLECPEVELLGLAVNDTYLDDFNMEYSMKSPKPEDIVTEHELTYRRDTFSTIVSQKAAESLSGYSKSFGFENSYEDLTKLDWDNYNYQSNLNKQPLDIPELSSSFPEQAHDSDPSNYQFDSLTSLSPKSNFPVTSSFEKSVSPKCINIKNRDNNYDNNYLTINNYNLQQSLNSEFIHHIRDTPVSPKSTYTCLTDFDSNDFQSLNDSLTSAINANSSNSSSTNLVTVASVSKISPKDSPRSSKVTPKQPSTRPISLMVKPYNSQSLFVFNNQKLNRKLLHIKRKSINLNVHQSYQKPKVTIINIDNIGGKDKVQMGNPFYKPRFKSWS